MEKDRLLQGFERAFGGGDAEVRIFFAPGRVNVIGEHIDYNGGRVFPCALTLGTYCVARARDDGRVRLASAHFQPAVDIDVGSLSFHKAHDWANYPKAVAFILMEAGHKLGGFDMYFWGDLPQGAGLSSSASVTVAAATALDALFGLGIDAVARAKLCQRAENEYIGVNCGIMDQFASVMGKANHGILLDCATLAYEHVPLDLGDYTLVIANTNKPRALAASKYNERRAECDAALKDLQKAYDITALCQLAPEQFEKQKHVAPHALIYQRAEHAVYEQARTLAAADALKRGDLAALGALMNQSHHSLAHVYEVSCEELDVLVTAAQAMGDAVLGARMTGAGFGGCTVNIVRQDAVQDFVDTVGQAYANQCGRKADCYVAQPGDGACEVY